MEKVLNALTALAPVKPSTKSSVKAYDGAIRQHIALLNSTAAEIRAVLQKDAQRVFENLDPAIHSISYLFILHVLSESVHDPLQIPLSHLLDRIVEFLVTFDPIQIRYAGHSLLALLERIGSGQLFSALVAVELLSTAILRIDPTGSLFTSTHFMLARLAYNSNSIEPALQVIDRDVLFYPSSANAKENSLLCEENLPPTLYISAQTCLTEKVNAATVLEYNYIRGLIYMSRRDWSKAEEAFEQVISHPSKDRGISKIMLDSHKRWLLVGLLNQGKAPSAPGYISVSAQGAFKFASKAYDNVAETFNSGDAEKLKSQIEENASIWEEDGTTSLLQEVLNSYQKWRIINLRHIYQRISISQVREMTLNAETGKPLQNDAAVEDLIRQMMEADMLEGQIEQDDRETYLSFIQAGGALLEVGLAAQIAKSYRNVESLARQYKRMNEQLSSSKEYVKHLVREQKRAEKDVVDAGVGFDSQIEDEDLMADVVTHS